MRPWYVSILPLQNESSTYKLVGCGIFATGELIATTNIGIIRDGNSNHYNCQTNFCDKDMYLPLMGICWQEPPRRESKPAAASRPPAAAGFCSVLQQESLPVLPHFWAWISLAVLVAVATIAKVRKAVAILVYILSLRILLFLMEKLLQRCEFDWAGVNVGRCCLMRTFWIEWWFYRRLIQWLGAPERSVPLLRWTAYSPPWPIEGLTWLLVVKVISQAHLFVVSDIGHWYSQTAEVPSIREIVDIADT